MMNDVEKQVMQQLVVTLETLDGWLLARALGGLMPQEKKLVESAKKLLQQ